jgi:hypothetical protein
LLLKFGQKGFIGTESHLTYLSLPSKMGLSQTNQIRPTGQAYPGNKGKLNWDKVIPAMRNHSKTVKKKTIQMRGKLSDSRWSHLHHVHPKAIKAKKLKRLVHKHDYLMPKPVYFPTGHLLFLLLPKKSRCSLLNLTLMIWFFFNLFYCRTGGTFTQILIVCHILMF